MARLKPYTILIAFGNLGIGGIQTKIVAISERLLQTRGGSVHIHLVLRDTPLFNQLTRVNLQHITIHNCPGFGPIRMPLTIYMAWKVLVLQPTAILTFHDILSSVAVIASRVVFWKEVRVVLNEDTLPSAHTRLPLKRLLIRIFYPHADRIIVPTRAAHRDLTVHFGIPTAKTVVIPNWTLMPRPRGFHSKEYDLLYVGRFVRQKNVLSLLQIMRRLVRWKRKLTLCLVGEGSEKAKILRFITRHGLSQNVIVHESNHEVSAYLDSAKVFVLYSRYEGMPVAMLEAMARGCPPVAKNYPGLSECLTDGKSGFIARSADEFIKKIQLLLTHPARRNQMGGEDMRIVEKEFSMEPLNRFISVLIN